MFDLRSLGTSVDDEDIDMVEKTLSTSRMSALESTEEGAENCDTHEDLPYSQVCILVYKLQPVSLFISTA